MDNFDDKIKTSLKKDLKLSNKYNTTIENSINMAIKNNYEKKHPKKYNFINNFYKIAIGFLVGILGITSYAMISSNSNLKHMGFYKLSENYEEKKVEINKKIENEYFDIQLESIASDSAYVVAEYNVYLKEKIIEKIKEYEEEHNTIDDDKCNFGVFIKVWINDDVAWTNQEIIKISETEYKITQVINRMNFDDENIHLKIWLDNFYLGYLDGSTGVKIGKMMEMDVITNNDKKSINDSQEQKIDEKTKIVLEKVDNSDFETYIRFKKITENITWKEFNNIIGFNNFMVSTENGNTISSKYIRSDIMGRKIYKDGDLVENYESLKSDDILRIEESCAVILEEPSDFEKIKIYQTYSTFFSDKTNEEKDAYYKAKWYPVEEGDKEYTAQNNNGGTITINKISVDNDNIIFYFDKSGMFGNTSYVDLRVKNNTMNYICPTKVEEKKLNSDENKVIFSRKKRGAGLNLKDGMLDDISKLEFTLLYGDVDEIIGEPFWVNIPKKSDTKAEFKNFKISDTIAERYIYSFMVPKINELFMEVPEESKEQKYKFKLDYFNGMILNTSKSISSPKGVYYVNEKNDVYKLKEELEYYFKENNISFEQKEVKSGEFCNF